MTRVGVVGHVEWVQFAVVERVPAAGEIVHARESFFEPAGGGAVAAVQLRKLAGVGAVPHRAGQRRGRATRVSRSCASVSASSCTRRSATAPQRRTFTFLDDVGERTITVLGERIVPWPPTRCRGTRSAALDAIYLTGGDAGAVRAARAARVLVATPRAMAALAASGVQLDVLVRSATDPGEAYEPGMLDPAPRWSSARAASSAGHGRASVGLVGGATPLPGPAVDAYGCGDSFAAALLGLGAGDGAAGGDRARRALRGGLPVWRRPYAGQLSLG